MSTARIPDGTPLGLVQAGQDRRRLLSLWDVEDVDMMPAVRDTIVGPVSASDVQEFGHRYHYTGTGGTPNWRWGLWHGPVLLGIVAYNLPTRSLCESVFGPEHHHRVWHMGRLSMADRALPNSESRLIGGSLRAISRDYPDVWGVLTYAATDRGHLGYVYQATNALYTGEAGEKFYYLDPIGNRRSSYFDGACVTAMRADQLGWIKQAGAIKHRYLYVLGTSRQRKRRLATLRLPVLPYPKNLEQIPEPMAAAQGTLL